MDDRPLQIDAKLLSRLDYVTEKAGVPRQDAPDVVQTAMSDAVRQHAAGAFRGDCTLGTWLHTILGGKIKDYWRAKARERARAEDAGAPEHGPDGLATSSRRVERIADNVQNQENALVVQDAIARLDPLHRLVLSLNQFGGYTTAEIADRLHGRPGTVGRILAEAKQQLRDALRPEESSSPQRLTGEMPRALPEPD